MKDIITRANWHSGAYRQLDCTKTLQGYYNAVSDFIEREGKPIGKTMLLVRSCNATEVESKNWGASWTSNMLVCQEVAKRYNARFMLLTLVSPNERMVHYNVGEDVYFYEEEYVLDMKSHNNPVLLFQIFREVDGEKDWWMNGEEDDYKIYDDYKKTQPELFQELCRYDVYRKYQLSVENGESLKKDFLKSMKPVQENKALGIAVDYGVMIVTPKSGVATKKDLEYYLNGIGVKDNCPATINDTIVPGVKRMTITHNSQEIGFYISSRLAKVV